MDEMIECKKDIYKQYQKGITRMGFTFKHSELPAAVKDAELGHRYYIVFVDADVYDESMGKAPPLNCYNKNSNATTKIAIEKQPSKNEMTEAEKLGDKLRQRACILCKEERFIRFMIGLGYIIFNGEDATEALYKELNIKSRTELVTNTEAQEKFIELIERFDSWKIEKKYAKNIEMMR